MIVEMTLTFDKCWCKPCKWNLLEKKGGMKDTLVYIYVLCTVEFRYLNHRYLQYHTRTEDGHIFIL